ncbi:hypothetical protein pipiens_009904 [Culex pipiens pipiens]|uniref:Major facilitator superfamily (MFS) profile domain-containing protein n=1 Tax=Culex pipiens pipiens TaxID=38569 RepID=A0ABD1DC42_CULPP
MEKSVESGDQPKRVTLEDALALTKFGTFNYLAIVIAGMIITAVMLETLSISFVIAVAECDLNLTTEQKGILGAVALVGIIVSSHLWGFLADTQGRRKVIIPTMLAGFGVSFVSSFTTDFATITACRFLTGFLVCGGSATIYAYLGEFHNDKDRSRAIMAASFVFGIGCVLMPGLAWVVLDHSWEFTVPVLNIVYRPWRLFLVICGLPGLIGAFALLRFPETPKFVLNQGDPERALETIQWMHRMNVGTKEPALQIELILEGEAMQKPDDASGDPKKLKALLKLIWNQTAPLFMPPYLSKTLLVCFLQFGSYVTAHGMYFFFPGVLDKLIRSQDAGVELTTLCQVVYSSQITNTTLELQTECTQSLTEATYGYSFILDVIYMLGFAVMGVIVNAVGRLTILVFVFTTCGICGVLTIFIEVPLASMWLYMVMLLCSFSVSVVSAVTVDLFPTNLRAMALGISTMCGRIGGVFGTNLNGLLLDSHCELTFGIASVVLLLCSVLSFFIPNINRKLSEPRPSVGSR